ncbi:capsular biosynthesis protein, partial [bacterium]|nr:capsular biosynthesis protein [bacterium]
LRVAGITPVLAHPERIRWFQEDLARLESAIRLGALGQMTGSSLVGDFGRTIAALAETMVRRGLVHALGSDAHDTEHRPPRLAAARARWAELAGEDSARIAVEDAPRAFLGGTPFEAAAPSPAPAPRGFLDRLLGR